MNNKNDDTAEKIKEKQSNKNVCVVLYAPLDLSLTNDVNW